jgi:hypothetical protein
MKASFKVREEEYQVDIRPADTKDEKFVLYSVAVGGQGEHSVDGILKLTPRAIEVADERATKEGGSAEEFLARGFARSLAAEVLIRKLKPEFSFVVDHRWIQEA